MGDVNMSNFTKGAGTEGSKECRRTQVKNGLTLKEKAPKSQIMTKERLRRGIDIPFLLARMTKMMKNLDMHT